MESFLQTWWIYALGAALFAALTAIFAKIGVQDVDSDLATAIRTLTFLILSGIATGLSWLCYFRALQLGPTGPVAALDKASLVLVVLFAALFLGEPLTWKSVIGVTLITLGTLILVR